MHRPLQKKKKKFCRGEKYKDNQFLHKLLWALEKRTQFRSCLHIIKLLRRRNRCLVVKVNEHIL